MEAQVWWTSLIIFYIVAIIGAMTIVCIFEGDEKGLEHEVKDLKDRLRYLENRVEYAGKHRELTVESFRKQVKDIRIAG